MFYVSNFALISFITMRNFCLCSLLGSGNWNICVTNPENSSRKQVTWIRYIFFLFTMKISRNTPVVCANLMHGLFFLTLTDNRISLPLFNHYTFGLLLGRGQAAVWDSIPPVSGTVLISDVCDF